ncbi:MAG: DUF3047 domain-containing protein, partial [Marinobacter sp.]|nr:DUF3047 domain-containing protein [Marinobacter sp.]
MRKTATFLSVLVLMGLSGLLLAQTPSPLTPFSEMQSLNDGWEPLEFPKIDQLSRYELTTEYGQQVVRATTDGGASGLIARVRLEPTDSLILQW